MVMVGHRTSNVPTRKMGKIFEDITQQQKGTCKYVGILSFINESIHAIHWLRATGLGAAKRVTRSVSGTKASHCANNGNACCVARSLICRQLLLPATFTPSTSRQFNNAPFVQSRSLQFCAAITNFAASWPHRAPYLACVVWPIRLHYCCAPHHRHHLPHSPPRPRKDADVRKSMHGTPDMYYTGGGEKCDSHFFAFSAFFFAFSGQVP